MKHPVLFTPLWQFPNYISTTTYLSIQASTICQDMKKWLFEKSKSFNVGIQIFPASFGK